MINPGDVSNLAADQTSCSNLAKDFKDVGIDKAVVVGNGIYLENNHHFQSVQMRLLLQM